MVRESSRLVINYTRLWSKQRKVHYSQIDISLIIWHPLNIIKQLNEEDILVLEPPRQEREEKRQASSSSRPGGGPMMTDPLHTLRKHPFWPSLYYSCSLCWNCPPGGAEGNMKQREHLKLKCVLFYFHSFHFILIHLNIHISKSFLMIDTAFTWASRPGKAAKLV